MVGGFWCSAIAHGVTADAVSGHALVNKIRRRPARSVVADVARKIRRDVIPGLRPGIDTGWCRQALITMAGATTAVEYMTVIDRLNRHPGFGDMAGITLIGSGCMQRRLPFGYRTVMTVKAGANHFTVVYLQHGLPGNSGVAGFAIAAGSNMFTVLAAGNIAVMARGAGAKHLCMIDGQYRLPRKRGMAGVTNRRRIDMIGRLAAGRGSVVTENALFINRAVIHFDGNSEAFRAMTDAALFNRGNMPQGLAGCQQTIVTTVTGFRRTAKNAIDMAGFAFSEDMLPDQWKAGIQMVESLCNSTFHCTLNRGQICQAYHP